MMKNQEQLNSELKALLEGEFSRNINACFELIMEGADANTVDDSGNTILHLVARTGFLNNKGVIQSIVDIVDLGNVNAQAKHGNTALMTAAYYENGEMVDMLLNAGADVSIGGDMGYTALDIAEHVSDSIFKQLQAFIDKAETTSSEDRGSSISSVFKR